MEKVKQKCEKCDFMTANRGYLKRHFRVKHEGVRGFQCDKCEYSAGHRCAENNVATHVKCVHNLPVLT